MARKPLLLSLFLSFLLLFSGCSVSLESLGLGKLEEMLSNDPIVCAVTAREGSLLTVQVLSADGHYDEGDTLYVDCTGTSGSFAVGDTVTFTYDYVHSVTVLEDLPYIVVDAISAAEYVPPETTEES